MQVKKGPNISFHTKPKIPHMKQMFESILLKLQEGEIGNLIHFDIHHITLHFSTILIVRQNDLLSQIDFKTKLSSTIHFISKFRKTECANKLILF